MIDEMGGDFLQWLRGFYFVAKRGSVTLAAVEMGRNQPTVSHQIKCLENEFGVVLFDRTGGRMELTPEGKVFLEKAISLFEVVKEMRDEVGTERLHGKGLVNVCTTHAIIHYFLPRFIVAFKKDFPLVRFEIEGGGADRILEQVDSAEADFGIASLDSVPPQLSYQELFETSLTLIAPKRNYFFKGPRPTLEEISAAPFIIFPRSSTITPLITEKFSEQGMRLNVVFTLNNFETVKKFVALGSGVSILDEYAVGREDRETLDVFPLDRFFPRRKYGLILRKKKYLPPMVRAFISRITPDGSPK